MIYEGAKTKNISFPLGGIGTGSIGLSGNGELVDWEIFNRPSKNTRNGYSHFAIKATYNGKSVTRVLHGDTNESLLGTHVDGKFAGMGYGPRTESLAGFPHFKSTSFDGAFPLARLTFCEDTFPATVRLTAFNPFIPHNTFDSSLPVAMFEWEIENTTEDEIEYCLSFTLRNPCDGSQNKAYKNKNHIGIVLRNAKKSENELGYSDLCMLTDCKNSVAEEYWYRGAWQDSCTTFWKNLTERERLPERTYDECGSYDHATLAAYVKIPKKGKKSVRFVLGWNVPNQYNYWSPYKDERGEDVIWKNYYATKFASSLESAEYALEGFSRLFERTKEFADSLQNSSLPPFVTDAVSANLSVLKSPTVMRLQDGSLWGWEGCAETEGSCDGTCQHVWNYAYALPFLFPDLERTLRENTLKYALYENGGTVFRLPLPLGRRVEQYRSCVDGQMGEVIKCYREWKISGDTDWLRAHADGIFKMLEFAWSKDNRDLWDADMDGVLEGRQHHTLDMELFGPSSWLEGFYLLALDCGERMARALGENERADKYRKLYENGKKWTNENLFNGRYFYHKIDIKDKSVIDRFGAQDYWNFEVGEIKYQVAQGCIIDQLLADWHSAIIGCDGVFDTDKKKIALESLYKNNYKSSMREVVNMWRNFSLNDESGTVICSYPDGVSAPAIPIPYCEETMSGFEYAFAGLLINQGFVSEGESVVRAVRERYDGEKRNPWNEIECGSNYARSMASYALMLIYSGFGFDATQNHIGFKPIKNGRYLWSVKNTWGNVQAEMDFCELSVLGEPLLLSSFALDGNVKAVYADGKAIDFTAENGVIHFDSVLVSKKLRITL